MSAGLIITIIVLTVILILGVSVKVYTRSKLRDMDGVRNVSVNKGVNKGNAVNKDK